jgi:acetylornithine/succinyldiaminopimelate/putrescine aminotransferase
VHAVNPNSGGPVGSWGPAILGHAHPAVIEAVRAAALDGFALGATGPREVELGELIRAAMPSLERMRFTSSGTEAAMSAVRLARGATQPDQREWPAALFGRKQDFSGVRARILSMSIRHCNPRRRRTLSLLEI